MKDLRVFVIALLVAASAETVSAWDNLVTHPDLVDFPATRLSRKGSPLDVYLHDKLGLRAGFVEPLAVQVGFDAEIDGDLRDASRGGESRFEVSFNKRKLALLLGCADLRERLPEDLPIKINDRCPGDPGTPGFDACFDGLRRFSVQDLLRNGVFAEDNPNVRARHHFHEPELVGEQGMDNAGEANALLQPLNPAVTACLRGGGFFDFTGRSARDRALDLADASAADVATGGGRNLFALPDAERYLYRSLTADHRDEREHYAGLHFLALGHVLHLLQDMTSPAHVRNDFVGDHLNVGDLLFRRTLEDRGRSEQGLRALQDASGGGVGSLPYGFLASQVGGAIPFDLSLYAPTVPSLDWDGGPHEAREFWQRSDEQSPHPGLTELVHDRFFSRQTISQLHRAPARPDCNVLEDSSTSEGLEVWVAALPARRLDGQLASSVPQRFLSSAQVPHLAKCRYHSVMKPGENEARDEEYQAWSIDESVHRDYLEVLFASALDATAQFLEFSLGPRLVVVREGPHSFRMANPTLLPFRARFDAVEVVYDAADGVRRRAAADCGGTAAFELAPAAAPGERGPASAFVCQLPVPPPGEEPAVAADFWIVVRGQHGERGAPVPLDIETGEWRAKDYVVAFDRVQPRLLYFAAEAVEGAADEDLRFPLDVFSMPIDLSRALPEDAPNAGATNLTEGFRAPGGSPAVDFAMPSGEVLGGTRIALRSDQDSTGAIPNFPDVAAPLRGYLFDPLAGGPLEEIPDSESDSGDSEDLGIRWGGGGALFYRGNPPDDGGSGALRRHLLPSGPTERFAEIEAFAASRDEPPGDLPLGTERDTCQGTEWVSAHSAAELAVTVFCRRERVEAELGQQVWNSVPEPRTHWEIRIASVVPSTREAGALEAQLVRRVVIQPSGLLDCGGTPGTCWERSGEPAGEELAAERSPVWSPDGRRIAFLRDPNDLDNDFSEEIWIADQTTGAVRRVLTRDHGDLYSLHWAPGGRRLVFGIAPHADGRDDDTDVFTIDAEGDESQAPLQATRGLDPDAGFSLYAPLTLPSAP